MIVRSERPGDIHDISDLTTRAFAPMPFSDGTEAAVIDRLRSVGALSLSLVVERNGTIAGHVAFSPMTGCADWYGLGPIAVEPKLQKQGIGRALVRSGFEALGTMGAAGCALVGDPGYYGRFGFKSAPQLAPDRQPADYFMVIRFGDAWPEAAIDFHPVFYETSGPAADRPAR